MRRARANVGGVALCLAAVCLALSTTSMAQTQASGTLTITATVQSSMSLVFVNNTNVGANGFCPLTNAGTNNASLDLGTASFTTGDSLPCVKFAKIGAAIYDVSSAFDVQVTTANTNSPNYRLAVSMSSVPPANVVWLMNATTLTTAAQTLQAANPYGKTTETLHVQVKNSVPAQILSETIFFTATAN